MRERLEHDPREQPLRRVHAFQAFVQVLPGLPALQDLDAPGRGDRSGAAVFDVWLRSAPAERTEETKEEEPGRKGRGGHR